MKNHRSLIKYSNILEVIYVGIKVGISSSNYSDINGDEDAIYKFLRYLKVKVAKSFKKNIHSYFYKTQSTEGEENKE